MPNDPQPNIMGMPTPVAQPQASNSPKPTAPAPQDTAGANPAVQMSADEIQAKVRQMQSQVAQQASPATSGSTPAQAMPTPSAFTTAPQAGNLTKATEMGIVEGQSKMNPNQLITAPAPQTPNQPQIGISQTPTQYQAYTAAPDAQKSIQEVARLNNISLDEAAKRYYGATNFEAASKAGQQTTPLAGTVYDPATNTYKDPRTLNYFQGLSATGTPLFSANQKTALQAAFGAVNSGVLTTDDYQTAHDIVQTGMANAKAMSSLFAPPSPNQMQDPTGLGSSSNDMLKFLNSQMSAQSTASQAGDQSNATNVIQGQISDLQKKLQDPTLDSEYKSILAQQMALASAKQGVITDIGTHFDTMLTEQTRSNDLALKKAMASANASGQVGSMLADSYLNSVIKSNESALRDVSVQRNKALQDAEQAYSQQNLQLQSEALHRVDDLQNQYNQLNMQGAQMKDQYANNLFDRQMKMVGFQQQLEQYQDQKQTRAETKYMDSVSKWAASGATLDENKKQYFAMQEKQLGLPPGYTTSVLDVQKKAQAAKTKEDNLKAVTSLYEALDKVPAGQQIEVNGSTYFGTQGTGKVEIDEKGMGLMSYVDQATGKVKVKPMGKIGKAEPGSFSPSYQNGVEGMLNTKTGEWHSLSTAPSATERWSNLLPDGKKPPFGTGQCGNFFNLLTNGQVGRVGDSLESKIKLTDSNLNKDPSQLQIGDAFVMSTGQPYGHIGFINAIHPVNGRLQLTLTESNWHEDGTVSNTRTMFADDPRMKGFINSHGSLPPTMVEEMVQQGPSVKTGQFGSQPNMLEQAGAQARTGQTSGGFEIVNNPLTTFSGTPAERSKLQADETSAISSAKSLISGDLTLKDLPAGDRTRAIELAKANGWQKPTIDENISTFGRTKDDKYSTAAGKLADDFTAASKDFVTQRNGFQAAQGINVNTTNPQDDISLVYAFMKVVDPTSVVRESEFNSAAKASSLLDQFNIKVGSVSTGQILNPKVRQDIKNTMISRFNAAQKNQQLITDTYTKRAKGYRIDPEDVITDYSSGLNESPSSSSGNVIIRGPDGQRYQYDLSDQAQKSELQEALKNGYTQE